MSSVKRLKLNDEQVILMNCVAFDANMYRSTQGILLLIDLVYRKELRNKFPLIDWHMAK